MATAGHITATLLLRLDGAPRAVELGTISLPLVVTNVRVDGGYELGIGVNLDNVRRDIAAIFADNRED